MGKIWVEFVDGSLLGSSVRWRCRKDAVSGPLCMSWCHGGWVSIAWVCRHHAARAFTGISNLFVEPFSDSAGGVLNKKVNWKFIAI